MATLLSSQLVPRFALFDVYDDSPGVGWIEVFLEPFTFHDQLVETKISLSHIQGVDARLISAAPGRIAFPRDPHPGYIEGSIYIYGRHHPVDVSEIEFDQPRDSRVPLRILAALVLGDQAEIVQIPLDLRTEIRLPLTDVQIQAIAQRAVQKLNATTQRQVGQVIAEARQSLLYEHEPALVAKAVKQLLGSRNDA